MTQPFYSYPGQVWAIALASLNYLSTALGTASTPFAALPTAKAVFQTLLNGLIAVNVNRISNLWKTEAAILAQVQSMPIVATPTDLTYYTNRLNAITAAGPALAALVPTLNLNGVGTALAQGKAAIPDPMAIEFFYNFNFETPPAGLTINNFPTFATQCATAFQDLATSVMLLEGINLDYIYDQLNRFQQEMFSLAEMLGEFLGFSATSTTTLWNQLFTLPTLLMHADLLSGAPKDLNHQQDQLVRFLLLTSIQNVATLILLTSRPVAVQVAQATVMTGDSLMDIASRSLANYERWVDIATLNKLNPPYITPTEQVNQVGWGHKVLIPTPGAQPGVTPDYLINFLGVDLYMGPINGDMPNWGGDFQLIAGYDNLRWALGRRMQTTLGTLIYHNDYGCRIPPEVGNVQTNQTAGLVAAFGKACLLSDPRVQQVPVAEVFVQPNFALAFVGSVIPAGFGTNAIQVNEVINASITPVPVV